VSLDFNIASSVNLLAGSAASDLASIASPLAVPASPSLADVASLLAATLDLKLVESLINAIRTADLTTAAELGTRSGVPSSAPAPGADCQPRPVVEPRIKYHPEPYFEPRPIFYYSTTPVQGSCRGPVEVNVECVGPGRVPDCELPFQPPWKVLPWQNPPPVILKVKVVGHRPDEAQKGLMVDLFI
jgi:hypothetical protein